MRGAGRHAAQQRGALDGAAAGPPEGEARVAVLSRAGAQRPLEGPRARRRSLALIPVPA